MRYLPDRQVSIQKQYDMTQSILRLHHCRLSKVLSSQHICSRRTTQRGGFVDYDPSSIHTPFLHSSDLFHTRGSRYQVTNHFSSPPLPSHQPQATQQSLTTLAYYHHRHCIIFCASFFLLQIPHILLSREFPKTKSNILFVLSRFLYLSHPSCVHISMCLVTISTLFFCPSVWCDSVLFSKKAT